MKRKRSAVILSLALAVAIFAQVFVFGFIQNSNDLEKIEDTNIGVSRDVKDAEAEQESAITVVKLEAPKASANSSSNKNNKTQDRIPLVETPTDVEAVPPSTQILSPEITRKLVNFAEAKIAEEGVDVKDDEAVIIPAKEIAAAAEEEKIELILDVVYYPSTGQLTGTDGKGILYLGFDYDSVQGIFYTPMYPWQRTWGFTEVYDFFSPMIWLFYDTQRLYFDYGGKQWMIQLWKGQYGITSGAEIGVYNRPITIENVVDENQTFYECVSDEDCLPMSFDLYKNDELFFSRQADAHWWLTGFRPLTVTWPHELRMEATITMKTKLMATAFVGALVNEGYEWGEDFEVEDYWNPFKQGPTDVSFTWQ